jgi:hypothetical protein
MTVETKYNIGSIVYLKTDIEQLPHIITSIHILSKNLHAYGLNQGSIPSDHMEYELTEDKIIY